MNESVEEEKPAQLSPMLQEVVLSVVVAGLSMVVCWALGVVQGLEVGILFAVVAFVTFLASNYLKQKNVK